MRTTLTIDDDVLAVAKDLAARQQKNVGEVISALARQALRPKGASRKIRNGVALLPVSVLQDDAAADDGLLRSWPRPAVDIHKHYGYAFQWWAMSALIAGLYVWYQLLRPRLGRSPR